VRHTLPPLAAVALGLCLGACAPVDQPSPGRATMQGKDQPPKLKLDPFPNEVRLPGDQKDVLQKRIEDAIANVKQRDLLTTHGFWTVFHGILGLGPKVELVEPDGKKRVNAIEYICKGNPVRGLEFVPTKHGLDVRTGAIQFVSQGHQDQFVAEMAQWNMPADQKFVVGGKDYTFMDFVRHSQMRARVTQKQELGWTILVLGQYLGTDIAWKNEAGEDLRFEDLLRYELNQPMDKAACGGTHRLFGLSWVLHLHQRKGGKVEGVWKDVADATASHQKLARKLQNPDGSFSTDFFRGRAEAQDMQLRINTSGHIFEWLALSLPDSELRAGWVQEAANAVAKMILDISDREMEGGTLYHAAHGLIIYQARVFERDKLGKDGLVLPLPPN
jgi:hypothetical protein